MLNNNTLVKQDNKSFYWVRHTVSRANSKKQFEGLDGWIYFIINIHFRLNAV